MKQDDKNEVFIDRTSGPRVTLTAQEALSLLEWDEADRCDCLIVGETAIILPTSRELTEAHFNELGVTIELAGKNSTKDGFGVVLLKPKGDRWQPTFWRTDKKKLAKFNLNR